MATTRAARLRTKQNTFMEKTTVFNLIILDESGSMSPLSRQTVDGCNETLNVIRSLQKKHGDTQRNLVSIFLFQDNEEIPSRYVCKNNPIEKTADLTPETYRPWGVHSPSRRCRFDSRRPPRSSLDPRGRHRDSDHHNRRYGELIQRVFLATGGRYDL